MLEEDKTIVHEGFREGLARICAKNLWRQINVLRMKKPTVRFLRGREQERQFVTQPQIADNVYRDQGTVAKWFRDGSPEWSNMAMVMTDLNIELFQFPDRLPDRDKRALAGRRRALQRIQEHISGSVVEEPTDEEACCLMAISGSLKWKHAKAEVDPDKRERKLKELASDIAREADRILGKTISLREHKQLLDIEDEWGRAWDLCRAHIRVKWSVA
jgi:hypothetical protein